MIDKYLEIGSNGPATYAAVILKIQQVSLSTIRNIVGDIKNMSLIKEPGQNIETFGYQGIEKTCCIFVSGSDPSNIMSIFDQCFIKYDVLAFKFKALQFYDIVDEDRSGMEWDAIIWKLKTNYRSIKSQNLSSPKATNVKANSKR